MKSVWPCPLLNSFVPAFRACPARRTEVVSYSNYPMPSRNGIHSTIALRDTRYSEPPPPDMPRLASQGWTYRCYAHPWLGTRDMLNGHGWLCPSLARHEGHAQWSRVDMSNLGPVGCACSVVGAGYWRAVSVSSTASGLHAIRTGAKREVPMPPETLTGVVRPSFSQSCKPFARHVGRSQLATKAP